MITRENFLRGEIDEESKLVKTIDTSTEDAIRTLGKKDTIESVSQILSKF